MPTVSNATQARRRARSTRAAARELVSRLRDRLDSAIADPSLGLPALLLVAFVLRAAWIDQPPGGLIFDEAYYVNASRTILGLPVPDGAHYAASTPGLDPNIEHPPLGKLLIAGSMALFGDGAVGWRLPSLIAGLIVIAAVYQIVRAAGETTRLAFAIAGFVAFDNLVLVHSRIATLDILVLAPVLAGAWLALRARWLLAGVLLGLAFLVKLSAVYGLAAVGVLLALTAISGWRRDRRRPSEAVRAGVSLVVGFGVVGLVGLWLLDIGFTGFSSPIDHLRHMFSYGADLKAPLDQTGACTAVSAPWQWLVNECEINYLRVNSLVREGETVVARVSEIEFRGAMNPLLIAPLLIALLVTASLAWRTGHRLATWSVVWALANWMPYVLLVLISDRVTYLFYFLPVIPAAAVFLAVLLWRSGLPRWVGGVYAAAYVVAFVAYFPFRQVP